METAKRVCGAAPGAVQRSRRTVGILVVGFVLGILLSESIGSVFSTNKHVHRRNPDNNRDRRSVDTPGEGHIRNQTPIPAGAIYTRWGRPDCPASSQLLYKGIVASGHPLHTGGGSVHLCMTEEPEYIHNALHSLRVSEILYGVEYKTTLFDPPISANQNAVCAVCQSNKMNKLMIPGRTSCLDGWTVEYSGYLMNSKYTDKSGRDYICVDRNPAPDRAGARDEKGAGLWHVIGRCPNLPCPKYLHDYPLTCTVCTR